MQTDRSLVEDEFIEGNIRVLCCTPSLAWGVNLQSYAVIIKGTKLYNAELSSYVDIGILDVSQVCFNTFCH